MIFSQVTLQVETTVKKKNGAEDNVINPITLPAVKQRIGQSRLDEFSMIGLGKMYGMSLTESEKWKT